MLNNVLGILIGFATVILVFALLVTTLSQVLQALMFLRVFYLRRGIRWLLQETYGKTEIGKTMMNQFDSIAKIVVTRDVSWLEKEELLSDLRDKASIDIAPELLQRFNLQFQVMSRYMTQKFTRVMQLLSFILALGVAVVFQLSALDLLKRLSTEPDLRAKLDALALTANAGYSTPEKLQAHYQNLSEEAISRFLEKHPEANSAVEEFSCKSADRDSLEKEMRDVLRARKVPKADQLVESYLAIVDELYLQTAKRKLDEVKGKVDQLALLDLAVWSHGWSYFGRIDNLIGVLISAVFISLGAPFWFNTLKNLTNLRDMLKPRERDSTSPNHN